MLIVMHVIIKYKSKILKTKHILAQGRVVGPWRWWVAIMAANISEVDMKKSASYKRVDLCMHVLVQSTSVIL